MQLSDIPWIKSAPKQPLCDVPWVGTAVVLSDGSVNFCCFSDAAVGNVNQQPFEKIWNGHAMQRIRKTLAAGQLPIECHSTACPFYRGDKSHFIYERMDGSDQSMVPREYPPPAQARVQIRGSRLKIRKPEIRTGESCEFVLELQWCGAPGVADVFVGVGLGQKMNFLPNFDAFAVPYLCEIKLAESKAPIIIKGRVRAEYLQVHGNYQLCAALFAPESNPYIQANSYWSDTQGFTIR